MTDLSWVPVLLKVTNWNSHQLRPSKLIYMLTLDAINEFVSVPSTLDSALVCTRFIVFFSFLSCFSFLTSPFSLFFFSFFFLIEAIVWLADGVKGHTNKHLLSIIMIKRIQWISSEFFIFMFPCIWQLTEFGNPKILVVFYGEAFPLNSNQIVHMYNFCKRYLPFCLYKCTCCIYLYCLYLHIFFFNLGHALLYFLRVSIMLCCQAESEPLGQSSSPNSAFWVAGTTGAHA